MTLKQLAKRLADIVAENDKHGWSERNDLPALVRISRQGGGRRKQDHFYTEITYVDSSQLGLKERKFCGTITVRESSLVK